MHLDTHAVVWLYESGVERFPQLARDRMENEELTVSAMVALELAFLHEIGRLTVGPQPVLDELRRTVGLQTSTAGFAEVVAAATSMTWTRDPFDRLICADARVCATTLLTRDRTIRAHADWAHWD